MITEIHARGANELLLILFQCILVRSLFLSTVLVKNLATVSAFNGGHTIRQQLVLCTGIPLRFGQETYFCLAVFRLRLLIRHIVSLCEVVLLRDKDTTQDNVLLECLQVTTEGTLELVPSISSQLNGTGTMHPHKRTAIEIYRTKGTQVFHVRQADDTGVRRSGLLLGLPAVNWAVGVEKAIELEDASLAVEATFVMESLVAGPALAADGRLGFIAKHA